MDGDYRIVRLDDEYEISARAVLIATGVSITARRAWRRRADRCGIYYGATSIDAKSCVDEESIWSGPATPRPAAIAFAE